MERDKAGGGCGAGVRGRSRHPAGWAERVADRIIGRYTAERPGWTKHCASMRHLKLVVMAELLREGRERDHRPQTFGEGEVIGDQ